AERAKKTDGRICSGLKSATRTGPPRPEGPSAPEAHAAPTSARAASATALRMAPAYHWRHDARAPARRLRRGPAVRGHSPRGRRECASARPRRPRDRARRVHDRGRAVALRSARGVGPRGRRLHRGGRQARRAGAVRGARQRRARPRARLRRHPRRLDHARLGGRPARGAGGRRGGGRQGPPRGHGRGGWAAHSGLVAAALARGGFSGPETVLEGRFGFYRTFLGQAPDATPFETLGTAWETLRIGFKPYPCCHYNHAYLDCALELRRAHG